MNVIAEFKSRRVLVLEAKYSKSIREIIWGTDGLIDVRIVAKQLDVWPGTVYYWRKQYPYIVRQEY